MEILQALQGKSAKRVCFHYSKQTSGQPAVLSVIPERGQSPAMPESHTYSTGSNALVLEVESPCSQSPTIRVTPQRHQAPLRSS